MAWTHYSDLIVWQKAMQLTDETYRLVRLLPREEQFSLSDQLRRSAISIPSNIAEGHGRQTVKDFKQFLSIALGSAFELETQIQICIRQQFFSEEEANSALQLTGEISRMLTKMITGMTAEAKN